MEGGARCPGKSPTKAGLPLHTAGHCHDEKWLFWDKMARILFS